MGQGVGDPLASLESPPAPEELVSADRPAIEGRVRLYLEALGVQATDELERLTQQVIERVEFRSRVGRLGEPLEAAIEEVQFLLDQWLLTELGIDNDPDRLAAARAAVLDGQPPGWTRRWAGLGHEPLAESIITAWIPAVPPPAPLAMDPNPIELCCHRLAGRLVQGFRKVLKLLDERRCVRQQVRKP